MALFMQAHMDEPGNYSQEVCDRLRTTLRIWKIDRFPLTGAVRDLVPVDTGNNAEADFAGRFVNLLRSGTLNVLP